MAAMSLNSLFLGITDLVQLLQMVDANTPVSKESIEEVLHLLEAGSGVKLDLFLHFQHLMEDSIYKIWVQMHNKIPMDEICANLFGKQNHVSDNASTWLANLANEVPASTTLRFRAVLLIFKRMQKLYTNLEVLLLEKNFLSFRSKLTMLPALQMTKKFVSKHQANMSKQTQVEENKA